MRVKHLIQFCLTASMLLLLTGERVAAQAWLEDRSRTEGHGIRLGDFELHPGLGTEVGYDSNIFLAEDDEAQDSAILRITPHIYLSTLSDERRGDDSATPPVVNFRVGGASSFYHYFYSKDLDDLSVGADLNLTINPDRPVSFQVDESFTREIRPFADVSDSLSLDYARNQNNLGALIMFATKSGLFKGGLGFDWAVDWFEADLFNDKDSFTYSPNLKTSWQFLPMTALVYDFRLDFQNYFNEYTQSQAGGSRVDDNARIASRIGVNGVLSSTISLTTLLGYAAGFYDAYEEYDSIVGQIEARWRASHSFILKLGYDRSFESALQGNFCRRDRGYANALLLMGGSFLLDLDLWAGLLQYGVPRRMDSGLALNPNTDDEARQDVRVSAKLSAEYRFIDWLAVTAALAYLTDITDYEYPESFDPAAVLDPADFNKFEAWLGVRAFY